MSVNIQLPVFLCRIAETASVDVGQSMSMQITEVRVQMDL